jgi:cobalt/nickel transport system permease protein
MGAFVFAAQMVNFPVGIGTSGHLVGAALLGMTVGPWAATVVMTAIVAVQALVFGDGGLLALGANVFNMAVVGVAAGYLPFHLFGGRARTAAVFLGGFLSVILGSAAAVTELLASGVAIPGAVLSVSGALFAAAAAAEGAITVLALRAIEGINKDWVRAPGAASQNGLATLGGLAVVVVAVGVMIASAAPDTLTALAQQAGFAVRERVIVSTPFTGYETQWISGPWLRQATAGIVGLGLVFVLTASAARLLRGTRRS